jgi:hypothetical protein
MLKNYKKIYNIIQKDFFHAKKKNCVSLSINLAGQKNQQNPSKVIFFQKKRG